MSPYLRPVQPSSITAETIVRTSRYALLALIFAAAPGTFYKIGVASLAWALIYVGVVVFAVWDRDRLVAAVALSWPILIFPLLATMSVFWSIEPSQTLRHSAQYVFSAIIGLWIGSTFRLSTIFSILCVILLSCVFVSVIATYLGLIHGFKQGDYVGAERYFIGLYVQKNIMGAVIVYAVLATLVVGAMRKRQMLACCLAILLFFPLVLTKSTTALLLCFAVFTYLPVLWWTQRTTLKALTILGFLLVSLIAVFAMLAADMDVVNKLLAALGKDTTLTGRTEIWSQGMQVFLDNPYLGVGYQAFWQSPKYATEVMQIRAAVLETIGGFHSGYLTAAVSLGVLGLLAYMLMVLSALVTTGRLVASQATALSLGAFYVIAHIFSRTFTESSLYLQHDLEFILLIALVVSARNMLGSREPRA